MAHAWACSLPCLLQTDFDGAASLPLSKPKQSTLLVQRHVKECDNTQGDDWQQQGPLIRGNFLSAGEKLHRNSSRPGMEVMTTAVHDNISFWHVARSLEIDSELESLAQKPLAILLPSCGPGSQVGRACISNSGTASLLFAILRSRLLVGRRLLLLILAGVHGLAYLHDSLGQLAHLRPDVLGILTLECGPHVADLGVDGVCNILGHLVLVVLQALLRAASPAQTASECVDFATHMQCC